MKKDYKKIYRHLYAPKPYEPRIVTVPELRYLMASGSGRPDEDSFQRAAATLFPVAYVSKFILKAARPEEDFTVMPMEVKWKLDRTERGSKRYYWTMMIMQPECVNWELIEEAIGSLKQKGTELPYEDRLRLGTYREGLCGQILHRGPYGEPMERTFDLLKNRLSDKGYEWEGDSHDIYFNDSRRTLPEKLKTLIRIRIREKDDAGIAFDDPFRPW